MKNIIIRIALVSALIAIASKIINSGWLTFVAFPIWGTYILLYIYAMVVISKLIENGRTVFFNTLYKVVTITFLFSFLLLPDSGDGNPYVFFDLIHFDSSGYGEVYNFLNMKFFEITSISFAVATILMCAGVIIARLTMKK